MIDYTATPFVPAPWLPNAHFQTIYASLLMPVPLPKYRREIIDLPDGDIIAADWVDGDVNNPLFILVHGMEGDSESRYARLLMNECKRRKWTGVVLHMRSCGGLINRKPQFYHAGHYADIDFFVREILTRKELPAKIFMAGVSLGGSQLTHFLAKSEAAEKIEATVLISSPMDLTASADYMKAGPNRLYIIKFRRSLLKKYRLKADLIDNQDMVIALARARNFWDLDGAATAPLHGFRDASHYYQEMSAGKLLPHVKVPTLYLASKDDPFVPLESMPNGNFENPCLYTLLTEEGGHVGFVDRKGTSWMVPTVYTFFETIMNNKQHANEKD